MKKLDYLVLSRQDYKIFGYYDSVFTEKGMSVCISENEESPYPNYRKEILKELLGEDFGKKDFYYEPKKWGFILEAIEKKIKEVLKTMKKVPKEYIQNPIDYLEIYKLENDDFYSGNMVFYEEIEEFLGELYHYNNKRWNESALKNLNLAYNNLKKNNYDKGYPLYMSVATVEDQKKYP